MLTDPSAQPTTPLLRALRPPLRGAALLALMLLCVACGGGGGGSSTAAGGEGPVAPPGGGGNPGGVPPTATAELEIPDLIATPGAVAGQVQLQFTAPAEHGRGPVTRYEIRHQVPHITATNASGATLLGNTYSPSTPGTRETIVLSGLEPGQTFQFVVRAIHSGGAGPYSHGAGGRVRDAGAPTAPAGAIFLSGPATLNVQNGYYRVTQSFVSTGTAFFITARNVTLDLGGNTVTYGSGGGLSYGVDCDFLYNSGTTTVMNGAFVQASNTSRSNCHGIDFQGGHDIRLTNLTITTRTADSHGIWIYQNPTGKVRIDHNTVQCLTTTVSNRHYPGVVAIHVEDCTRSAEIDHNTITATPQWGIKVVGTSTNAPYHCWVHHNRFIGTRARVANGYMIGVHKPNMHVFENYISCESRGIHIDGVDNHGHGALVHDNDIFAQDQPNAEFNPHWCHGIKIENPNTTTIYNNSITVMADSTHSEARALDIDVESGGTYSIVGNRINGISNTTGKFGRGIHWTGGSDTGTNNLLLAYNTVRATDQFIYRSWHSQRGALFAGNAFVRDFSKPGNPAFDFEYWDNQNGVAAPGHRIQDSYSAVSSLQVDDWDNPGLYDSTREFTFRALVRNNAGDPVSGASVLVRDRTGGTVLSTTTNGAGVAEGILVGARVSPGPVTDHRGPFSYTVSHAFGTFNGNFGTTTTRRAVIVTLAGGGGSGILDSAGPTIPSGVYATPLSASRAVVRWTASSDASGIAAYLVFVGGQLQAITPTTEAVLSGLTPGASYGVTVQAIDNGGNLSSLSGAVGLTQRGEDRGR